jgi:O-acetyl-ADP-ribose deacetylase (regulator of RNase III)
MALTYRIGNVLFPVGDGKKIIVHICNDRGAWNGGFTGVLNNRWIEPKIAYKKLVRKELGAVQFIAVDREIRVANLIAQTLGYANGPPIRYAALKSALQVVAQEAIISKSSVHMPRIGCGLAGGSWSKIEPIINAELVQKGINVFVYDLRKNLR